jgi:putative transposase
MGGIRGYGTDLSDAAWALLAPLLPPARPGGRPRTTDLLAVLDAILYPLRTGCQWRLLPRDFPPWSTVHHYFRSWRLTGVRVRAHRAPHARARTAAGRPPAPRSSSWTGSP